MATVFKDKTSGQILRIDYGDPVADVYAEKEGLKDWKAEKMGDAEAKTLLDEGPSIPKPSSKTIEERIQTLEDEVFKIKN